MSQPVETPKITKEELSKHRTPNNCWIKIGDSVYNLSNIRPPLPHIRMFAGRELPAPFVRMLGDISSYKVGDYVE
jgi:hypothetical protein